MSKPTKRRGPATTVADLDGGEIARVEIAVRVTHRKSDGERWAIPLRDDMSESRDHVWLSPATKVIEVVPVHRAPVGGAGKGDVDPLVTR